MGNVSVLPSAAADAVYSLAGAAGRTCTYSDETMLTYRTVHATSYCHLTSGATPFKAHRVCGVLTGESDVFEVTLTARLLADCSTATCPCSIGQSQQQTQGLETYIFRQCFYMTLDKITFCFTLIMMRALKLDWKWWTQLEPSI